MDIIPLSGLTRALFGNARDSKVAGLEIWTDRSIELGISETTEEDQGRGSVVALNVIPQQIEFKQVSRISEQVIKDGKAFFFWRKDRHSNHLDLLEVALKGVTRSLMFEKKVPRNIGQVLNAHLNELKDIFVPSEGKTPSTGQVTKKQKDWLTFWSITREPYVDARGINEHHIALQTPALPTRVEFVGHFAGPIQWDQNANNPFLVNWNLSLIVHRTDPSLDVLFNRATYIATDGNAVPREGLSG